MRPRAIRDLARLSDPELFGALSLGMRAALDSATALASDAQLLHGQGRLRASTILLSLADEEAAKFHILLDAARTPRDRLSDQLSNFNDHVAKGIYAAYMGIRPASFGEVLDFVDRERKEYYLDGPSGFDWIYRNDILESREGAMYLDYIEQDGTHSWREPRESIGATFWFTTPAALRLGRQLSAAGFATPQALEIVAAQWRSVSFHKESHWTDCLAQNRQTLRSLNEAGLVPASAVAETASLVWDWLFPLRGVDLSMARIKRSDLDQQRSESLRTLSSDFW